MTVPGRKILAICALIVIVLATVAGWWMVTERPRPGAYIDALALEGDFVVAIRGDQRTPRAFVELVALGEGLRWQAMIPAYRVPDGAIGVAAAEHAITVRFPRQGKTRVWGFAVQNAKKLGVITLGDHLPDEPDGHVAATVATFSGGAQSIEILEPDAGPTLVAGVALTRGAVDWTTPLPARGVDAVWIGTTRVVVAQPGSLSVIARDGGASYALAVDAACVIPDRDADLAIVAVGGALRIERLGATAHEGAAWHPLGAGERFTGLCGRRGDRLYALVEDAAGVALLSGEPGAAPRRDALGAGRLAAQRYAAAPLRTPFAGDLDRVVAVALEDAVIGVDLEARGIRWRRDGAATLVDAGARTLARAGDTLASIDPATGAAEAVRAPDTLPLEPHHVAGGTVWLIGERGLVALDTATFEVRGTWRTPPAVTR